MFKTKEMICSQHFHNIFTINSRILLEIQTILQKNLQTADVVSNY